METTLIKFDLQNVHETLLLPLWGRAEAAKMKNPVFEDHNAMELIKRIDYDFTKIQSRLHLFEILTLAIRAKEFDEIIRSYINVHPRATIVNIGAGLDTTFSRVDNGQIKWYDMDVPDVIALRDKLLKKHSKAKTISKSMFDQSFLKDIEPPQDGILFLLGGVLMYFEEQKVQEFLKLLSSHFPGAEVIFDTISPFGVRITNQMILKSGVEGAKMKWGIRNTKSMESWGSHPKLIERYPIHSKTKISFSWGMLVRLTMTCSNTFAIMNINRVRLN